MKQERPHYFPLIIGCILPWTFFSQTINEATESIVGNQNLISKVPVPLQVFPYVAAITNFSTLLLSIPVVIAISTISGISISWSLALLLPHYFVLLVLAYSFGTIFGIYYVFLRDLKHAIGIILQIWFYSTPIVYEPSMIPEGYRWILKLNPVGSSFAGIQDAIIGNGSPSFQQLLTSIIWCFLALAVLRFTFSKFKSEVAEVL